MAEYIAERLRPADAQEIIDAIGKDPKEQLLKSFEESLLSWTGFIDGEPFVIFGAMRIGVLSVRGSIWLLGTDRMEQAPIAIGLKSRYYISKMLKHFARLENYVSAENETSIKWLKWCGAVVGAARPWGVSGKPFHYFLLCATPQPLQ